MKKSKKIQRISFFKPIKLNTPRNVKKIPLRNLTWPQAQVRYPRMDPFGDADHDGKLNMFDCHPFDKKRHGDFISPPEEYATGEIMDPYYDEYQENLQVPIQQPIQPIVQSIIQPPKTLMTEIRRKIVQPHKWARPGVYNEGDYSDFESASSAYAGSAAADVKVARLSQPTPSGKSYGAK